MATIADFLGQGALAPYADDIVAVGHTPESFFGLVADDAVDTINRAWPLQSSFIAGV